MELKERLDHALATFTQVGWSGLLDIVVVTLVIYAFLVALKRTRRSGLVFTGMVIVAVIYLVARKLNLVLTVALLQGFFAIILVALVVIFQEDLRYFFERVGLWWVERHLPRHRRTTRGLPARELETLARTMGDLARARTGALVVIRGRDALGRHLTGGTMVGGRLSEPLLKSIFDPHSLGHDGAVIIDGRSVEQLGVYLPLSKNLGQLPHSGTRHAAALGLSERSDALCIVVSEERGEISVARRGHIRSIATPAGLGDVLTAFYGQIAPQSGAALWEQFYRKNYREKAASLALAIALWVVVVQRSQMILDTFKIPVTYGLVPSGLLVTNVTPREVSVTLSGQRKEFGFMGAQDIRLVLDLSDVRRGRNSIPITAGDLTFPRELTLEDIEPRRVTILTDEKPPESNNPANKK